MSGIFIIFKIILTAFFLVMLYCAYKDKNRNVKNNIPKNLIIKDSGSDVAVGIFALSVAFVPRALFLIAIALTVVSFLTSNHYDTKIALLLQNRKN